MGILGSCTPAALNCKDAQVAKKVGLARLQCDLSLNTEINPSSASKLVSVLNLYHRGTAVSQQPSTCAVSLWYLEPLPTKSKCAIRPCNASRLGGFRSAGGLAEQAFQNTLCLRVGNNCQHIVGLEFRIAMWHHQPAFALN